MPRCRTLEKEVKENAIQEVYHSEQVFVMFVAMRPEGRTVRRHAGRQCTRAQAPEALFLLAFFPPLGYILTIRLNSMVKQKASSRKQTGRGAAPPAAVAKPDLTTEQRILAAARLEFCERGLDGARMQAIADRAGVNKALLHYYFRTKEKLFEIIIHDIASNIWRQINEDLDANPGARDFRSAVRSLVSSYIMTFAHQPEIPLILIRLLINRDRNFLPAAQSIIRAIGDEPRRIFSLFEKETKTGSIKKLDPVQLIMSVMSMIIMTFVSRPIVEILQQKTGLSITYDEKFYKARIDFITNLVFDGIKEHSK
jgi:TetR/AcrR family transcriptional regulator